MEMNNNIQNANQLHNSDDKTQEISTECSNFSSDNNTNNRPVYTESGLTEAVVRGIIGGEMIEIRKQLSKLDDSFVKLTSSCKENLDYGIRYQKNTVAILQNEAKEKDKYINGLLLVDLLKPIAGICNRIERRITKAATSDKKFLLDLLEEITEIAEDEYGVEIIRTSPGEHRPENISKVGDTVLTDDSGLVNLVAESVSPAWLINGRIIQKEIVNVYKYEGISSAKAESAPLSESCDPAKENTSSSEAECNPLNRAEDSISEDAASLEDGPNEGNNSAYEETEPIKLSEKELQDELAAPDNSVECQTVNSLQQKMMVIPDESADIQAENNAEQTTSDIENQTNESANEIQTSRKNEQTASKADDS